MEDQFQMLFEKMQIEMQKQTAELKISISNAIMDKIDGKIKPVLDGNEELKIRIEELEKEIDFLKRENNQNNMIIFGLKEQAENTSRLIQEVKSMGSRLSTNAAPAPAASTPPPKQQKKPQQQQQATTPSNTDNNNSAAWKKPSAPLPPPGAPAAPPGAPPAAPPAPRVPPPPPLLGRPASAPAPVHEPDTHSSPSRALQPCSMSCGRGAVPSLSCAACLCLYHPACAGLRAAPPDPFFCKNCRKSSSPPLEPPPLTHKSGVTTASLPVPVPVPVPVMAPVPRRVPVPVPVPVPGKVPRDKRVLLRMKVAGGTPDGERVWAVAGGPAGAPPAAPGPPAPAPAPAPVPPAPSRARAPRPALPQGLAVLNGRRFVVVPRNMVHATHAAK